MMGGRGQRMGGVDKSKLVYDGKTFQDIALSRLKENFAHFAISTGRSTVTSSVQQFTDIEINGATIGPASGLLAALIWAKKRGLFGIVTLPVDTPILPDDICEALCASGEACYALHDRQPHWLHAAWPLSEDSKITKNILEHKIHSIRGLHRAIGSTSVNFPVNNASDFKNINTIKTLAELCQT